MGISRVSSPFSTMNSKADELLTGSWAYTKAKVVKCDFQWTIDNFCNRCKIMKIREVFKSPIFPAGSSHKPKWFLELFLKGCDELSKDYLSLYLVSCNKTNLSTKCKFSILNANKEDKCTFEVQNVIRFNETNKVRGWHKFIPRNFLLDDAKELLPGDKLTILCELTIFSESINISGDIQVPECRLSGDFGQLFEEQKLVDVILSAKGREFPAHKAILAARSSVFSAMFQHGMEGKERDRVEITDVDPEVLREMLHYIYSGKVSYIKNRAEDLLVAADKYGLGRLKVMCEEHISKNLSVGNAAEYLILANKNGAKQLKVRVFDFINMHNREVMISDSWRAMIQTQPFLAAEVLRTLNLLQLPSPIGPPMKKRKL